MPTVKEFAAIAIFVTLVGMAFSERSLRQDKGTPITFHVTSVRSEEAADWLYDREVSGNKIRSGGLLRY